VSRFYNYAVCRYADCRCAECRGALGNAYHEIYLSLIFAVSMTKKKSLITQTAGVDLKKKMAE
jgi:hypothetical protein